MPLEIKKYHGEHNKNTMKQICVITFLLFTSIQLPAQNPYIQHFTTQDGLPSNTVYPIIQDSKRFIWFGTDAGVARYDGNEFTCYSKKDGLSCNDVIVIKEDLQGRIWFFNFNGTVNYFHRNKIFTPADSPFLDSLKTNHFYTDFFQDTDSTIYFYSFSSNYNTLLNPSNEVKKIKIPGESIFKNGFEIVSISVILMCRSPQNDFLLYSGAGLHKWNDFEEKPVLISDSIAYKTVYQINNNKFIFQARYDSDTNRLLVVLANGKLLPPVLDPVDHKKTFTSIIETDGKLLWLVTKERGVFVMKDFRVINHLAISEGQDIIQDHEGNVWVSTAGNGVYRINPSFNSCNHLSAKLFDNKGIIKLYPYRDEGIWMTNGNKVYLRKDCDFYTLNFSTEKSLYDQIYYLKNNSLIIGKGSYNFYQLREIATDASTKTIGYKYNSKGIPLAGFKTIAMGKTPDKICGSTAYSLIFFNEYGYFNDTAPIFLNERIHHIFYNRDDELVVNARKNYVFRNGQFERYPTLAKFDNQIITQYLPINDSIEAFLIEGDSIFLTCNHRFCNITALLKPAISDNIIKIFSHEEAFFIVTTKNIFVCSEPAKIHLSKSVDLKIVDVNFKNINDYLVFQDSLYVASDNGLTIIPEAGLTELKTHIPIPYFQSVQINGKEADLSTNELFLTGKNRVRFSFGCINYSSSPIIYSYQLEGLDENWVMETTPEVVYQNLAAGDYIFRVKAQKPGTEFSLPVDFKIHVSATLWERPIFYIGILLLISGWILWSVLRRSRRRRMLLEMDNQLITLEQRALQSMMNPHFIFNALGSIQNYILQSKPAEAGLYLSQFARLIRQNLNAINSNMTDLEEEIDRLKNYLDLERLRLDYKFDYKIEFEEGFDEEDLLIPSMIIQPFVENAVWHGIAPIAGKGTIGISFGSQTGNRIKIAIEDNGVGVKTTGNQFSKSEQHLHLGVEITRKRLEILGKKLGIKTSIQYFEIAPGNPNPGTRVILIVPASYQ